MSYKKENKDYKLMNDEVVRPLFKNSSVISIDEVKRIIKNI